MLRGQEDGGGGLPQTSQTAQSPTNTQVEHTSLRLKLNGTQVSITSKNIQHTNKSTDGFEKNIADGYGISHR